MNFTIDSGDAGERPVGYIVTIPNTDVPVRMFSSDDAQFALKMAAEYGVQSDRLYTGAFVNRLQGIIAQMRDERVKLQGENELLQHEVAQLSRGQQRPEDDTQGEGLRHLMGKLEAEVAELQRCVGTLQAQMDAGVGFDGDEERGLSILDRIRTLEATAAERGTRLADLERRQDQDDHERASGDGMPDAPERKTPEKRETFSVGDDVHLVGAVSQGGHTLADGWYRCTGIASASGFSVQVKEIADPRGALPASYWTLPTYVVGVRHNREAAN